ncbi:hypothetical protein Barb6_03823 [Bacteroidales bacterium Barb6]|nr:hypothetical protein Barb6_03823 [Bacteroidales bacterium Barb6]
MNVQAGHVRPYLHGLDECLNSSDERLLTSVLYKSRKLRLIGCPAGTRDFSPTFRFAACGIAECVVNIVIINKF